MPLRQPPLPRLWLLTDRRNDAALAAAIAALPRGAGVIFRHYHLVPSARRARFRAISRICRARGLWLVLAGSPRLARRWGADGSYGPPVLGVLLATAHNRREVLTAARAGAAAVLLSPVYPTATHPGGATLGSLRFRAITHRAPLPVIALGGMNAARAKALKPWGWAAIDGLSGHVRPQTTRLNHKDS